MFWGCLGYVEMGSWVGVTVKLNHSAYTEQLDKQGLLFAHGLTEEN